MNWRRRLARIARRAWHPPTIVGLVVCALLIISALVDQEHARIPSQQNTTNQTKGIDVVPPARSLEIPHAVPIAPERKKNPQREEWRQEESLAAQRDASDAAWSQSWAAWLSTVLAGVGIWLL